MKKNNEFQTIGTQVNIENAKKVGGWFCQKPYPHTPGLEKAKLAYPDLEISGNTDNYARSLIEISSQSAGISIKLEYIPILGGGILLRNMYRKTGENTPAEPFRHYPDLAVIDHGPGPQLCTAEYFKRFSGHED